MLSSLLCQSQDQVFISDSIKSINLSEKAFELYDNELYTQALDTFFESLNVRKKLYGHP